MMGAERKSMVMSEKEKVNTAYHEAGHAIVGWVMPEHDPIHKVTIIPRGRALGVTMYLPLEDKISESKRYLIGRICSLYGGRIAEEMILGKDGVTTGAMSDIEHATRLVRAMITRWGLSEKLGPLMYAENQMGKDEFSAATSEVIDSEMRRIIEECYTTSRKILEENIDILHAMKDALIEYETLDAGQVEDLMNRRPVRPPQHWDDGGTPATDDPKREDPGAVNDAGLNAAGTH